MMTLVATTALPRVLQATDLAHVSKALSRAFHQKKEIEIGVRFVSLTEIQELNRIFRGKNRPTDVLSFSAREEATGEWLGIIESPAKTSKSKKDTIIYWGDLAICSAYAKDEARRRGLSLREELLRLMIHGVLHLGGYDHASEEDELKMFGLQERVLETVL